MSSALVGVCGFRRLLRRDVIGVYREDGCPVDDMVNCTLVSGLCYRIREEIVLFCTSLSLETRSHNIDNLTVLE